MDSGIPLGEWSGSAATRELDETIRRFNERADEQTKRMIRLTQGILCFTIVMVVSAFAQIAVAILLAIR